MRKVYLSGRAPKKYAIYNRLINSYTWQLLRRRKFLANPLCEECAAHGRVTPAEEVHHVIPVENGRDEVEMRRLAYDYSNLRSLCKACHAAAHAKPVDVGEDAKKFFNIFFEMKKTGSTF